MFYIFALPQFAFIGHSPAVSTVLLFKNVINNSIYLFQLRIHQKLPHYSQNEHFETFVLQEEL